MKKIFISGLLVGSSSLFLARQDCKICYGFIFDAGIHSIYMYLTLGTGSASDAMRTTQSSLGYAITSCARPALCTLHNWRGNTSNNMYRGDYMHCDLDTIPWATFQDNMHSVHAQWGTSTLPVDILLVSGINNLANGESVELIIIQVREVQARRSNREEQAGHLHGNYATKTNIIQHKPTSWWSCPLDEPY